MMTQETFEELFENTESDLSSINGDNAWLGLMIIAKYIDPNEHDIIKGAEHDAMYSVDVDEIVEAGITEDDTIQLAKLNWCIDSDCDCLMCFV